MKVLKALGLGLAVFAVIASAGAFVAGVIVCPAVMLPALFPLFVLFFLLYEIRAELRDLNRQVADLRGMKALDMKSAQQESLEKPQSS